MSEIMISNLLSTDKNEFKTFASLELGTKMTLYDAHVRVKSIETMFELVSKSNALIENLKTDKLSQVKHFAWLKSSSITLENTIIKRANYQPAEASSMDKALVYGHNSIINLKKVSFENVKPENDVTMSKYRHMIEASGNVTLKEVIIKDCMYNTAILMKDADINAQDVRIVNNVGYHHLVLKENVTGSVDSSYKATMSNVYVGDNVSPASKNEASEVILLAYNPLQMKMMNVSVHMQANQTGCLAVHSKDSHYFKDFVNVTCPTLYSPLLIYRKDAACSSCRKPVEDCKTSPLGHEVPPGCKVSQGRVEKSKKYITFIALILFAVL